ncbi:Hypothetical_protein [Hexamita inflata]|uniref:Hypothetical_protein n=1 Tax=Hexamita inflata TaxID=28002 RepID=A0AA86US98_9EUKA|nr:Hypothetical protein HINF_LOCUS57360 [Hexamita inflata]
MSQYYKPSPQFMQKKAVRNHGSIKSQINDVFAGIPAQINREAENPMCHESKIEFKYENFQPPHRIRNVPNDQGVVFDTEKNAQIQVTNLKIEAQKAQQQPPVSIFDKPTNEKFPRRRTELQENFDDNGIKWNSDEVKGIRMEMGRKRSKQVPSSIGDNLRHQGSLE